MNGNNRVALNRKYWTEGRSSEPAQSHCLHYLRCLAQEVKWSYPLCDDLHRCYAGHLPSPLSQADRAKFFELIYYGTEWLQPSLQSGEAIPRQTAWVVKSGCKCTYRYGRIEVPPAEYPPWMGDLMDIIMPACGLSVREKWPDSCNANYYAHGGMSVGWHADDETLFQGKVQEIQIISLSLGDKRRFQLRYNRPDYGAGSRFSMILGDGDLLTMEGKCQKHMQHCVPQEKDAVGPRINLTW